MSEALAERCEEMLGEFAEWLHASAREAHRRLMESESAEDFSAYNNALHKLGRGLRQTLALHKRFRDERAKGEAEAARKARDAREAPRAWKRARIRHALERLVWDEHERDEDDEDGPGERLLEDIEHRLAALMAEPDVMDTPDEVLIAKLCEAFGLDAPPHVVQALAIVAAADAPRPRAAADTS
jgi:hypothetical protein